MEADGLSDTVNAGAFPGDALELPALKLRDGRDAVVINGLGQGEHLVSFLQQPLHEGGDIFFERGAAALEDVRLLVVSL